MLKRLLNREPSRVQFLVHLYFVLQLKVHHLLQAVIVLRKSWREVKLQKLNLSSMWQSVVVQL